MSYSKHYDDASRFLRLTGTSLLGVFLVFLVTGIYPFAILDAEWQLRLCSTLVANGSLALVGATLIALSGSIESLTRPPDERHAWPVYTRNWARWLLVAWLLVIPLNLVAGVRSINTFKSQRNAEIRRVERIQAAIRSAEDKGSLLEAVRALPGMPDNVDFTDPVPVARQRALDSIQSKLNAAKVNLADNIKNSWINFLKELARTAALCGLYYLGFSALATRSKHFGPALAKAPSD